MSRPGQSRRIFTAIVVGEDYITQEVLQVQETRLDMDSSKQRTSLAVLILRSPIDVLTMIVSGRMSFANGS